MGLGGSGPLFSYTEVNLYPLLRLNSMSGITQSIGSGQRHIEVSGVVEVQESFGRIMTSDPDMAKMFRSRIRKLLQEARRHLSTDARNYLSDDPRKAARAVKSSVYKTLFGGNLSILQKRTAGARYELRRPRKLDGSPNQRGGNRRPRMSERNRLDYYFGADRGFILRFINSGTTERETRYGNRGSIRQSGWFGHTAPFQMEAAAEKLAEEIEEYVKKQTNG